MKKNSPVFLIFTYAFFMGNLAWSQEAKPLKILLIGNSFSQNATRYLPVFAEERGRKVILGHAEPGGCSLQRHWDSVAASLSDTSRGKLYAGKKSLRNLLMETEWDVVTIQQYSLLSGDSNTYQPYAKNLCNFIKQFQPGAKIFIHQTWAYRDDAKLFGKIDGEKRARNQREMFENSRAAYHHAAEVLGINILPSGDAFYKVNSDPIWRFQADKKFDTASAQYPHLPAEKYSLHIGYAWTKEEKLGFDANHANEAGCYLAGLVWFGILFHESPGALKFRPEKVSPEFAIFLKATAAKVIMAAEK